MTEVVAIGDDVTFHRTAEDAERYVASLPAGTQRLEFADDDELAEHLRWWIGSRDFLRESTVNWTLDDLIACGIDFDGYT